MIKKALKSIVRPFVPKRLKHALCPSAGGEYFGSKAWWSTILGKDGYFHWEDLTFDLRNQPNAIFIRDEILVAGEYDFYLEHPCVVLDIGMNIGDTPLYFARMPHVKKVFGFEPMQATYDWAVSNFGLNPAYAAKIVPTCAGISDKSGTTEIELDYQEGSGGASIEIINETHRDAITHATHILKKKGENTRRQVRLESIVEVVQSIQHHHPEEALVVKCDAEGAEWKIVPALERSGLLGRISVMMIEYHYQQPGELLRILSKAGFVCFLRNLKHIKAAEIGNIYAARSDVRR